MFYTDGDYFYLSLVCDYITFFILHKNYNFIFHQLMHQNKSSQVNHILGLWIDNFNAKCFDKFRKFRFQTFSN